MIKLAPDIKAEIKKKVEQVKPKVVEIRRDLHQHPERSKREERTSNIVAEHLTKLGIEITRGKSVYSVIGVLNGDKAGKTVGLRADMDALRMQEQADLPFASEVEGVMHACGHDAHTAILMGVAEILSGMKKDIPGKVKFLFQPSEEAFPGGALPMIEEGALENPKMDGSFALHVGSIIPTGCITIDAGPRSGGVTAINITVKGKGGHFARPHIAVDPIVVAAHVLVGLQSMVTRQVDYQEPFVLTFGQIIGGTRDNVIPEEVIIRGDMGAISDKLREDMEFNVERLVKGVTESMGASYEIKFWRGYPTLVNDAGMTDMVKEVAASLIGEDNVRPHGVSVGGEDYAFFAQKVPSAMLSLGAWDQKKYKEPTRHHDPKFDMDEACIPIGLEIMVNTALEYLVRNA